MNKEIGNVAGVSIMVNPETYEDIKKRKTIYENEILTELQHRIDKAIEYIEEHNIIGTNKEYLPSGIEKCYSLELMDILRGEDNE